MKFSDWAKDYDKKNPDKLRVMTYCDLIKITEWDTEKNMNALCKTCGYPLWSKGNAVVECQCR